MVDLCLCKKINKHGQTMCFGVGPTCNTDSRYPKKPQNAVYFIPFPKPQRDKKKCVMWIRLAGQNTN